LTKDYLPIREIEPEAPREKSVGSGRMLRYNEHQHYQKVAVVLKETIRLMAQIDGAIPSWPLQ